MKAEFGKAEISKIRHFSRILDEGTNGWKYASFEGVEIVGILRFYGIWGKKKRPWKTRFLEILECGKGVN